MIGKEAEEAELSDLRRDEIIEALAGRIESMGMVTPAILLLEAHKPLSFLGSQALLIAQPFLSYMLDPAASKEYASLLEERGNVELLIRRLENGKQEKDRAANHA